MNRFDPGRGEDRPALRVSIPASAGEFPPRIDDTSPDSEEDWLRPAVESVLATVLLVAVLPMLAAAALLIKLTSPGPMLYTQTRVGRGGRRFTIYKLRTMRHNCEAASGIRWATRGDPRITWVGRLLRAAHIDELPQLVNVIRGDMSLIGPRPERPEFVAVLAQAIPDYARRQRVRPGVTGLAQIQLPPDTDLKSVRRKLALDLLYIRERTFWLNARIAVGTVLKLAAVPFAWIRVLLGLPAAPAETPLGLPTGPADETVSDHPNLKAASCETVADHPTLKATPAS